MIYLANFIPHSEDSLVKHYGLIKNMLNTRNKSMLYSLAFVIFADSFSWGIVFSTFANLILNPHSTLLHQSVNLNTRTIIYELLLAIYSIFMFLFSPIIGGISDKYGRKIALNISMLGLTVGFLVSMMGCLSHSIIIIVLGRIISGVTAGSLSVAQAAVFDISTESEKPKNLSLIALANGLGFACGPFLSGILDHFIILSKPGVLSFIVGASVGCIALIAITLFFQETSKNFLNEKININTGVLNIKKAFVEKSTKNYCLSFLFAMLGYTIFFCDLPVYMHIQYSFDSKLIGMILSGFAIAFSTSIIILPGKIFKLFSTKRVVISCQLIQLLSYFILLIIQKNIYFNLFMFLLVAMSLPLMYIGQMTLISNATPENKQGSVMGVATSVVALTWGLGPFLVSFLNSFGLEASFFASIFFIIVAVYLNRNQSNKIHFK